MSTQFLVLKSTTEQRHTFQHLINGGKCQQDQHYREIIEDIENYYFETNTPHLFSLQWIICTQLKF